MKTIITVLLVLGSIITASATPVPWVSSLELGGIIIIPAGKVLILEQACNPAAAGTTAKFALTGTAAGGIGFGAFIAQVNLVIPGNGIQKFPAPLRLGPGMTIRNAGTSAITLTGIALDAQDFPLVAP
ncbi:MAG: hypothetical protein QOE70_1102 [Chthoniobacter sp.]|jgi:hypothetical protein|nr:hypothetical protein [Chthoniobacter sp.]